LLKLPGSALGSVRLPVSGFCSSVLLPTAELALLVELEPVFASVPEFIPEVLLETDPEFAFVFADGCVEPASAKIGTTTSSLAPASERGPTSWLPLFDGGTGFSGGMVDPAGAAPESVLAGEDPTGPP
jgi:hypothetical protein